MTIKLIDDGTLDTVFRCSECGQEIRTNYADSGWDLPYEEWLIETGAEISREHADDCKCNDEIDFDNVTEEVIEKGREGTDSASVQGD